MNLYIYILFHLLIFIPSNGCVLVVYLVGLYLGLNNYSYVLICCFIYYYVFVGYLRHHCLTCGLSYKNRRHLLRHIKNECVDAIPQYQCSTCGRRFTQKHSLINHQLRMVCVKHMVQGVTATKS